jgi:hypothetical protein
LRRAAKKPDEQDMLDTLDKKTRLRLVKKYHAYQVYLAHHVILLMTPQIKKVFWTHKPLIFKAYYFCKI